MSIATKTLAAINEAMTIDQGAKFRGILRSTMPLVGDAYDDSNERFRSHLGASLIGRKCDRELWYSFRWTSERQFDGRMLRLFNRGHLEEARMVASLLMIGCIVHQFDENGKQFRLLGHGGHYGSAIDSAIEGCPDVPNQPILGEFKTHNDKSFQKLKSDGVMSSKWEHFVQMQQYMGWYKLGFALYLATNKNDDELHGEIVTFDERNFGQYWNRAGTIINAEVPPKRINESPAWFECKFCDYRPVCHGNSLPVKTCRSCVYSRPRQDKEWVCTHPEYNAQFGDNVPLSKEDQMTCMSGCNFYEMILEMKK